MIDKARFPSKQNQYLEVGILLFKTITAYRNIFPVKT